MFDQTDFVKQRLPEIARAVEEFDNIRAIHLTIQMLDPKNPTVQRYNRMIYALEAVRLEADSSISTGLDKVIEEQKLIVYNFTSSRLNPEAAEMLYRALFMGITPS